MDEHMSENEKSSKFCAFKQPISVTVIDHLTIEPKIDKQFSFERFRI